MDPAIYFKMLMIGFFEKIASERGIPERCSDSISICFFLGYDLTEATPDHSTLSLIRGRLSEDTYLQFGHPRGLNLDSRASCSHSFFSVPEIFSGTTILVTTIKSPRGPSRGARP